MIIIGGTKALGKIYIGVGMQWLPKPHRDAINAIMTAMEIEGAEQELNKTMNEK